ncbi:unnamed protein product [Ectocarpus fasciculatus]
MAVYCSERKTNPSVPADSFFFRCSRTESCRSLVECYIRPAACGIATVSPCLLRAHHDTVFFLCRVLQGAVMSTRFFFCFYFFSCLVCSKQVSRLWGTTRTLEFVGDDGEENTFCVVVTRHACGIGSTNRSIY